MLHKSAHVSWLLQTPHEIGEFGLKIGSQKYNGLNFKLAVKNIMVSISRYDTLMKLLTISSHRTSSELENAGFG